MNDAGDGQRRLMDASFEVSAYERVFGCLARNYQNYLDVACSPFGLSSSQVPMLLFLAEGNSGVTQNQIARALGVDKGTVSRNVRALVDRGLISQQICARDSRACTIELTANGEQLMDPLRRVSSRWTDTVTAGLTEKQRTKILGALSDMATRAELLSESAVIETATLAS